MLNVQSVKQLADILQVTSKTLEDVLRNTAPFYENLVVVDPARPGKLREVVSVKGQLRTLQTNLLCNLLKPNLKPSPFSHGGVVGRNILTNAEPHRNSVYYLATDITDFYPTIGRRKILSLFSKEFRCSREVSYACTKLCTRDGRLAQGLIASPILADRLMAGPDRRIGIMCDKLSKASRSVVPYTRYVDDLTISAKFPIDSGSTPRIVSEILKEYGFKINHSKHMCGRFSDGGRVTKLRVNRGRLDISPEYFSEVEHQLLDAKLLASGSATEEGRPYYTPEQIFGRIQFIGWVNPGRLGALLRAYESIDWPKVEATARDRNLVASKKSLIKKRSLSRSIQ